MNTVAFDNLASPTATLAASAATRPAAAQDPAAFQRTLKTSGEALQAARQLVSSAFIQPLLAQMREDPFRSEMFHGGMGEDAFGQQLDTLLSDRIVQGMSAQDPTDGRLAAQGTGLSLVDAVYRRLMRQPQPAPSQGRLDTRG